MKEDIIYQKQKVSRTAKICKTIARKRLKKIWLIGIERKLPLINQSLAECQ